MAQMVSRNLRYAKGLKVHFLPLICAFGEINGWSMFEFKYVHSTLPFLILQDDTYTESYISTIGVDFVSIGFKIRFCVRPCWRVI